MKIDVRVHGLEPSERVREHVLRHLHFNLGRFGAELGSVLVRVGDVNGPRGGVDKRCQVTLRGRLIGEFTVEGLEADSRTVIERTLERAARVAGRRLEKSRSARRRGSTEAWS